MREIHAKDLIPGRGAWSGVDASMRHKVVDTILDWLLERKHKFTFAAIDKTSFANLAATDERRKDLKDERIAAAFHIVLSLQKAHQIRKKPKSKKMTVKENKKTSAGHTVLIFDSGKEPERLVELVVNPPSWSDSYYGYSGHGNRLDQIIDVPYYAGSHRVPLLQISDLICYILRYYSDYVDFGKHSSRPDVFVHYKGWTERISNLCIGRSDRYMKSRACDTSKFFTVLPL